MLVIDKSTDHDKPHFNLFFTTISTSKNFFTARAEKGIARHIDVSSVIWTLVDNGLVIFDWFVLSMRMQVILDSLFARPGSAPIWGEKKGDFRDWTICDVNSHMTQSKTRHNNTTQQQHNNTPLFA